jgi:hypothetical protein
MARVINKFAERAKTRDPLLEADLFELYRQDEKENSLAQLMLDSSKYNPKATRDTRVHREYIIQEGV